MDARFILYSDVVDSAISASKGEFSFLPHIEQAVYLKDPQRSHEEIAFIIKQTLKNPLGFHYPNTIFDALEHQNFDINLFIKENNVGVKINRLCDCKPDSISKESCIKVYNEHIALTLADDFYDMIYFFRYVFLLKQFPLNIKNSFLLKSFVLHFTYGDSDYDI